MKLTENRLREIIREELISTDESVINEGKSKKWAKQVKSETGYDCEEYDGGVMIPEGPSANPDYDGTLVWGWAPGDTAWTESEGGAASYSEDIDNIDDFIDLVNNPGDTMGKWS